MDFRFKKRLIFSTLMCSLLTVSQASQADDYTYTDIIDPNSTGTGTFVSGALGSGGVFGTYVDSNQGVHGFIENNGVYTDITNPNGSLNNIVGVLGNGAVVGNYTNANDGGKYGFTEINGVYTDITVPNSSIGFNSGTTITGLLGNAGVTGYYTTTSYGKGLFTESNGVYTDISYPNGGNTQITGTDNGGVIGFYYDSNAVMHGFIENNGVYTDITNPNAVTTSIGFGGWPGTLIMGALGNGGVYGTYEDQQHGMIHSFTEINGVYTDIKDPNAGNGTVTSPNFATATGTIVAGALGSNGVYGYYVDSNQVQHSFTEINGVYTDIADPKAMVGQTVVMGVLGNGGVYGIYQDSNGVFHNFIEINGVYTDISAPNSAQLAGGAQSTFVGGSLGNGGVFGTYIDSNGVYNSFVATPAAVPVPATIWLFGSALVGLIGFNRRKVM